MWSVGISTSDTFSLEDVLVYWRDLQEAAGGLAFNFSVFYKDPFTAKPRIVTVSGVTYAAEDRGCCCFLYCRGSAGIYYVQSKELQQIYVYIKQYFLWGIGSEWQ